jgi:hypothetical protein
MQAEAQDRYSGTSKRGEMARADSNLSRFAGRLGPAREILSEERREGPRTLMIFGWNGRHERTRTADLFRVKEAL